MNRVEEFKIILTQKLEEYFLNKGNFNKIVYESVHYSITNGGKRIRPILFLLTYSLYKDDFEKNLDMALAIEMIHTYSLIHDDLPCMDNDDLRRGKPTNHKVYGENIAVLAGDTLLNEASSLMVNYSLREGKKGLLATKVILDSSGPEGMIGGQIVDVINEGKDISREELVYMHTKKTGELIMSSIIAGAIVADANEKDINILREYGYKLGLAFQIKDDILDLVGDVNKLGKNIGSDKDKNKSNFISLFGLEYCIDECNKITESCIKLLDSLSVEANELKKLTVELLNREY